MNKETIIKKIGAVFPGEHTIIKDDSENERVQHYPKETQNLRTIHYQHLSLNVLVLSKCRFPHFDSGTEIHIGGITLDNDNNVLPVLIYLYFPRKYIVLEEEAMKCFEIGKCNYLSGEPFYCPDDDYIQFIKPEFHSLGPDEISPKILTILIDYVKDKDLYLEDETPNGQSYRINYQKKQIFDQST